MAKKEGVKKLFDNIAPDYDKLNHILSLNIDKDYNYHITLPMLSLYPLMPDWQIGLYLVRLIGLQVCSIYVPF